nr:uncharacterized protein LOC117227282 [Megalopta genalis]
MQTDLSAGPGLAVVAGDVLALRGTGLAAAETWALLCQAAQALQDLFLSNGGVVGGSRAGPVVTLHTLELTPRGRVLLQLAPPETARAYLPPEYRPGRVYSDTDSEKMWMYSLGRALLDTTPRVAALTGTVSVSPSSALQSVLAAMTEPDPRRRASLMNLLDVISEYCRTRLQSKPFTHIVMDMYREVVKSPQYAARQRVAYQHLNPAAGVRNQAERQDPNRHHNNYPHQQQPPPHHLDPLQLVHSQSAARHHHQHQDRLYHPPNQFNPPPRQSQPDRIQRVPSQFQMHQQHQDVQQQQQQSHVPKVHHFPHHHPAKGALFKLQSQNSHSHPNLTSLCGQMSQQNHRRDSNSKDHRAQFQSQLNVQASSHPYASGVHHQRRHHHSRTYSQPIYTRLQHTRSSGNLPTTVVGENNTGGNVYSDPIYAQPVKPFLSSQDVRVNGLSMKPPVSHNGDVYASTTIGRRPSAAGYSHPDITTSTAERVREEVYGKSTGRTNLALQRQCSNPQLPNRDQQEVDFKRLPEQNFVTVDHRYLAPRRKEEQIEQQPNPVSSMRVRGVQGPPKPPRIITSLKKATLSDVESSKSEPPAKPPRNLIKNGPRARRGKAVQRAPSRLYRTVGGPMRSFNKAQCVGPEFVVRANQPPKTLCVGQVRTGVCGRIVVIMLTGQRVEVTCDPQKVTAGDLFQAIVQAESLDENFTLGLAVLLAGDFAILPPETKLNKVAPPGWLSSGKSKGLLGLPTSFMLYLRLRFFLPSLRGIRQNPTINHISFRNGLTAIVQAESLDENFTLGLAVLLAGDFAILPPETKLNKVAPPGWLSSGKSKGLLGLPTSFMLYLRLRFFLPSLRGIRSWISKHLLYLQIRRCILEQQLVCPCPELINLTGLALQAEFGNYNVNEHGCGDYFLLEHYIPESLILNTDQHQSQINNGETEALRARLHQAHRDRRGLDSNKAEEMFITHAQTLADYGSHYYIATVDSKELEKVLVQQRKRAASKERSKSDGLHDGTEDIYGQDRAQEYPLCGRIEIARLGSCENLPKIPYSGDEVKPPALTKSATSNDISKSMESAASLNSEWTIGKFGVPTTLETKASPTKTKSHDSKTKIAIANTVKNTQLRSSYPMQLEEYQNKENENPEKEANIVSKPKDPLREPGSYSFEEDALYAQVNVRLEPEGESRDTEDESERSLTTPNEPCSLDAKGMKTNGQLYSCPRIELGTDTECGYSLPKILSSNNVDQLENPGNPEELYAAINKVGIARKVDFPVPDEVWDVSDVKKSLHKMKTSSLPNYGTSKQPGGYRTPSLPRRLGVKMGTRAIYNSLVQKDTTLTDDMESLSLKSDAESSIQSLSGRSTESPLPEAYVLNADIRTDDETFHVTEDESMSVSLAARLEELSFAEERILQTIKLERGHGGSIGLQVTEGNDGGVYVQAVSVGGSADMAGNVNKGDRIVAINGQNLLHLRYEEALKMLQSSCDTIELVLSQATSRKNAISRQNHEQNVAENNYLNNIRFDVSSEADTSSVTNKWLVQRTTDGASVQNTSSAYSSAASSAMGNHNANSLYMSDLVDNNALKSASILLNIEDFDVLH